VASSRYWKEVSRPSIRYGSFNRSGSLRVVSRISGRSAIMLTDMAPITIPRHDQDILGLPRFVRRAITRSHGQRHCINIGQCDQVSVEKAFSLNAAAVHVPIIIQFFPICGKIRRVLRGKNAGIRSRTIPVLGPGSQPCRAVFLQAAIRPQNRSDLRPGRN
jgi:hypothetical protein